MKNAKTTLCLPFDQIRKEMRPSVIRAWLKNLGVETLFISPLPLGKRLQRELQRQVSKEFLDMEAFTTLKEAQVLTEQWRHVYNHIRPHISLGYKPPAPLAYPLPDVARRAGKRRKSTY